RSAGLRFERVSPQVYAILAEEEEFKSSEVVRSADKLPEDREAVQNLIIGKVTNGTDPLPGASVRIKNSLKGTATDTEGNFELAVDEPEVVLIVSFLGYLSQEVTVKVGETITIALMPDLEALEEVVVVGYGTQKKITLTSSVSTIEADEILKSSATNVSNALVGRLPGLIAVKGNGKPGAGSSISIRGASTFGDNSALIVVDGIVRDFQYIDPNEIESISILKDASATAVYGSRAA